MHILVAGGLGYIGSNVVVELIKNGHTVVIIDNLQNAKISVLDEIIDTIKISVAYRPEMLRMYEYDLLDMNKIEIVFSQHNFDWVINLAGLKSVGESVANPILYYSTNITIMTNLLKVMENNRCRKLLFSSSATVYGTLDKIQYSETDPIGQNVSNPYGMTKYIIEEILQNVCEVDKKWTIVSLRYYNPIGAQPNGYLGDNPPIIPNNIMPVIVKSVKEHKPFTLFGNDYQTKDGTAERDYIHILDLANAHVCAITYYSNNQEQCNYHTYNVGTGHPTSVLDIIHGFETELKCKLQFNVGDRRAGDLPVYYANTTKINEKLNWYPKYDIVDAIKNICVSMLRP